MTSLSLSFYLIYPVICLSIHSFVHSLNHYLYILSINQSFCMSCFLCLFTSPSLFHWLSLSLYIYFIYLFSIDPAVYLWMCICFFLSVRRSLIYLVIYLLSFLFVYLLRWPCTNPLSFLQVAWKEIISNENWFIIQAVVVLPRWHPGTLNFRIVLFLSNTDGIIKMHNL